MCDSGPSCRGSGWKSVAGAPLRSPEQAGFLPGEVVTLLESSLLSLRAGWVASPVLAGKRPSQPCCAGRPRLQSKQQTVDPVERQTFTPRSVASVPALTQHTLGSAERACFFHFLFLSFLFWPPRGIWSSQARDRIPAAAATWATAVSWRCRDTANPVAPQRERLIMLFAKPLAGMFSGGHLSTAMLWVRGIWTAARCLKDSCSADLGSEPAGPPPSYLQVPGGPWWEVTRDMSLPLSDLRTWFGMRRRPLYWPAFGACILSPLSAWQGVGGLAAPAAACCPWGRPYRDVSRSRPTSAALQL